jgi:hypothetical protein
MEMIASSKDKDFQKQIRFANTEVREHINMLMEGEAKLNEELESQNDLQKKGSVASFKSINNLDDGDLSPLSKLILEKNTQR